MIYQWNESQTFVRKYKAIIEIDINYPLKDVIRAIKYKFPLGGYYYTRTPLLDIPKEVPIKLDTNRKLRHNIKMSLMISEELVDDFLKQVGQRNKQDIIRGLISDWVKKEKRINSK